MRPIFLKLKLAAFAPHGVAMPCESRDEMLDMSVKFDKFPWYRLCLTPHGVTHMFKTKPQLPFLISHFFPLMGHTNAGLLSKACTYAAPPLEDAAPSRPGAWSPEEALGGGLKICAKAARCSAAKAFRRSEPASGSTLP